MRGNIFREIQYHRPHHWHTTSSCFYRLILQIRHQTQFHFRKEPSDGHRFLAIMPWHCVYPICIETTVRRYETKLHPTYVKISNREGFKSSNIMTQLTKACKAKGKPVPQTFRPRWVITSAISTPVNWKFQRSHLCRTG